MDESTLMICCDNCFREGVPTHVVTSLHLCRKSQMKYNNMIYVRNSSFHLCLCCDAYIVEEGKAEKKPQYYWPAMIARYLFLENQDDSYILHQSMKEKWSLIPTEWRLWWITKVQTIDPDLTLEYPEPKFVLATDQYNELMEAIGELKWLSLSKAIDKHLSHPSVRCPFGCSEFLHKTNKVAFEDFLTIQSNGCLNSYCDTKQPCWTSGIKPNFPSKIAILDDSNFWCNPCIIVDDHAGIKILTCRYHNQNSRLSYFHVPESPTGTLCTPNSNNFAPAKIRTRTIRPAKLNGYSDTYELAMLQGGFDGMDSTYVSTSAKYDVHDELANKRDCLSIQGRDDMYYHVAQLSKNKFDKNYLPERYVEEKLRHAGHMYPNVSTQCQNQLAAATFMPLSQAVSIQEGMYNDTSCVLKIYKIPRELGDTGKDILYKPKWPSRVVGVHPNDGYGNRFGAIKNELDNFVLWVVVGVVSCVPEVWTTLYNGLKDNIEPCGYILSYAWKCVKKNTSPIRGKDPFSLKIDPNNKEKNKQILCQMLQLPGHTQMDLSNYLHLIFGSYSTIALITDQSEIDDLPESTSIIFWVELGHNNHIRPSSIGDWELRYVAHKKNNTMTTSWEGLLYARHGNDISSKWWKQNSKCGSFWKATSHGLSDNYLPKLWVYVKNNPRAYIELRKRYFATMNGQNVVYCKDHKQPLITNYDVQLKSNKDSDNLSSNLGCCYDSSANNTTSTWDDKICDCTNKNTQWVCPTSGCGIALCDDHMKNFITKYPNDMYLLGKKSCRICDVDDLAYSFLNNNNCQPQNSELLMATTETDVEDYDHGPLEGFNTADMLYMDDHNNSSDEHANDHHLFDTDDYLSNAPFHQSCDNNSNENDFVFEGPENISSIPFHVLTNKNGHLLVRRNAKLRMNKKHENVQQRICATSTGKTLPFVYAEALLFPDIFFKSEKDGTILGAIPTGLWADSTVLNKYGIAAMKTHAQTRIFDPSLLCSTDSRYHFMMFDCIVNLGLRGQDSRVVLHRGFADRQSKDEGVCFKCSDGNNEIYGETVDDQANVHKLSALTGKSMPHFFITQSCNQKSLRGLRIFRNWLQDEKTIQNVMKKHNVDHTQAKRMLRLSACAYIGRTWNVVADLWMQYIFQSPEEPLGPIEWAWWRKEFQDETGNVSHIHGIAKSKLDTSRKENLNRLLNMIRGNLADLVHHDEIIDYERKGYIDSLACLKDILHDATKYLPHTCHSRCQIPRTDKNGETSYYCKVPNNYLMTPTPQMHSMLEINVEYSPRAMQVLVELGMAYYNNESLTTIAITNEKLKMIRHVPKSTNSHEKFSPTSGLLFVLYPSSQNLQFCTGMSINAYLTKYAAGIDKVSILSYIAPKRGTNGRTTRIKYQALNNTKITSVKVHNAKRRRLNNAKRSSAEQNARLFTHTELLSVVAGENLVNSTVEFKFMQTSPKEFRASSDKNTLFNPHDRPDDMINISDPPNILLREKKKFPLCRQFSKFQKEVIEDELKSPLKLDDVTLFSMRPPELRFVNKLSLYTEWFEREGGPSMYDSCKSTDFIKKGLNKKFHQCLWIDGFNGIIKIRYAALIPCLEWALHSEVRHYGAGNKSKEMKNDTVSYLRKMIKYCDIFIENKTNLRRLQRKKDYQLEWKRMQNDHLVRIHQNLLPTVWFTPVYPRRKHAFLIQLLLSFGRFETEYEIMLSTSLRGAFEKAGLLDPDNPTISVRNLMNMYVDEHLSNFPGSKYQFARCLVESYNHLQNLFLQQNTVEDCTPPILQTHMTSLLDKTILDYLNNTKSDLIRRIHEDLVKCGFNSILPSVERLQTTRYNPLSINRIHFFPPDSNHSHNQQLESIQEQTKVMKIAKSCVENYINPSLHHRNLIICGGPGVGKTTVCQLTSMYILSRGLNMITTSLVARRSKELGGIHYHRLLACTDSNGFFSPGRQAEKTLSILYRKPQVIELLRSLDCLFIDELGLFSAEQMAVLDIILRYIKSSSFYMGGIFVFGTIDVMQLMTFQGTPFLMSGFILTDYQFVELTHSVRAANDPILQDICNMTRTRQWTTNMKLRFEALLTTHCHFLDNFHDPRLPEDAIFVFGKKAPCREAEDIMLDRMKILYPRDHLFSKSIDQESSTAGNWKPASIPTQNSLNNRLKRKQQLMFYPKAKYEFTYNDEKLGFMQGQLAYLLDLPDAADIANNKPILLYASPPGCKYYPQGTVSADMLNQLGWYGVNVPYSTSQAEQISSGIQAKRSQYGLRPRVASTIHAAMGSTLPSVVTSLVPINGSTSDFGLWDPAQVVVLLSRTQFAKDIYFIGNASDTVKSLLQTLQRGNKNLHYINTLLDKLCLDSAHTPVYHLQSKYCSQDAVVPTSPGVYILASTKNTNYFYIGESTNLSERLNIHNQGTGPSCTRPSYLRPWGMLGFVTGFQNVQERRKFESIWKVKFRYLRTMRTATADELIGIALQMCRQQNSNNSNSLLRFVQTGRINNN